MPLCFFMGNRNTVPNHRNEKALLHVSREHEESQKHLSSWAWCLLPMLILAYTRRVSSKNQGLLYLKWAPYTTMAFPKWFNVTMRTRWVEPQPWGQHTKYSNPRLVIKALEKVLARWRTNKNTAGFSPWIYGFSHVFYFPQQETVSFCSDFSSPSPPRGTWIVRQPWKSMACIILFGYVWWCLLYRHSEVLNFQETRDYHCWFMVELSHMVPSSETWLERSRVCNKRWSILHGHKGSILDWSLEREGAILYQAPYSSNCMMMSSKAFHHPKRKLLASHCAVKED